MKTNLLLKIISVLVVCIIGFFLLVNYTQADLSSLWRYAANSLFPNSANWSIGSATTRILKGWFGAVDISGTLTTNKVIFNCPAGGCEGQGQMQAIKEGINVLSNGLTGYVFINKGIDQGQVNAGHTSFWLNLGNQNGPPYTDYSTTSNPKEVGNDWGVIKDGSNLSGVGHSDEAGFCNFWVHAGETTYARATIDENKKLHGYIWCANIGYVNFDAP